MLLSLQLFDESRCFHNRCDNGDKGLKQRLLTFNTRQLFRPIGTRQWYPPHAFGAQGSADHLDWFATTRLPRGLQKRISQKRVEPASGLRLFGLRPLGFSLLALCLRLLPVTGLLII